jgi:hypothetical protein
MCRKQFTCCIQNQPTPRNKLNSKTLIPSLGAIGRLYGKSPHSLALKLILRAFEFIRSSRLSGI